MEPVARRGAHQCQRPVRFVSEPVDRAGACAVTGRSAVGHPPIAAPRLAGSAAMAGQPGTGLVAQSNKHWRRLQPFNCRPRLFASPGSPHLGLFRSVPGPRRSLATARQHPGGALCQRRPPYFTDQHGHGVTLTPGRTGFRLPQCGAIA
ncbi:hypothetical protein D3C81_397970 [compost metagenome]